MRPIDLARLVALAAVWGASFLFMRHAVPHLGPALLIELRVLVAGIALAALVHATGGTMGWRGRARAYVVAGIVGVAAPFLLIAGALTTIDASTAAILNALSPLFASLVAAAWMREPITAGRAAGIALCLAGTAVLVGWTPAPMSARELAAAGMSVAATAFYGYAIVFTKVRLAGASPLGISAATLLVAAAATLPFAIALPAPQPAADVPASAWLAALALALLATALAYLIYYRLLADVGPVRTITVTLLVPVFGMVWGIAFLGEPLTAGRVLGCAIILFGCSLILGLLRLPAFRRPASSSRDTDQHGQNG